MSPASEGQPTEGDAADIARRVGNTVPESVRRFSTGLGHWVYDVRGRDGSSVVVRLGTAHQRDDFRGAIYWSKTLRPLGVPLPRLLDHGEHAGLPYLVLERLPGEDLGRVYDSLTSAERKSIAEEVCRAQRLVGALPEGQTYGWVRLPGDVGYDSWSGVIGASLARSRRRIDAAGLVSPRLVESVAEHSVKFNDYFSRVRPTPFLDDVTTKNVLVHAGRFSGIVDVDWLCFGDPLLVVAQTRTALLSAGANPEYVDHWCQLLSLTSEERRVILFYTAVCCVDFMSEYGQRFSQGVKTVNLDRLMRLETVLTEHLNQDDGAA